MKRGFEPRQELCCCWTNPEIQGHGKPVCVCLEDLVRARKKIAFFHNNTKEIDTESSQSKNKTKKIDLPVAATVVVVATLFGLTAYPSHAVPILQYFQLFLLLFPL